jgi:hypothetical protein
VNKGGRPQKKKTKQATLDEVIASDDGQNNVEALLSKKPKNRAKK